MNRSIRLGIVLGSVCLLTLASCTVFQKKPTRNETYRQNIEQTEIERQETERQAEEELKREVEIDDNIEQLKRELEDDLDF